MVLIWVEVFKDDAGFTKLLNMTIAILGVCCMSAERYYRGEVTFFTFKGEVDGDIDTQVEEVLETPITGWTWTLWLSETILLSCFMSNVLPPGRISLLFLQVTVISLVTMWLQGMLERYISLVIVLIVFIFSHQFGTGQSEISAIFYYMEMRPHLLIIQFIVTSLVTLWLQGRFWRYVALETLQILIGIAISSSIVTPEEAETLHFEKEKAERRAKNDKKWKKQREQKKSVLPEKERLSEKQMEKLLQEDKKTKKKVSTTILEKWLPRMKTQVAKMGSR